MQGWELGVERQGHVAFGLCCWVGVIWMNIISVGVKSVVGNGHGVIHYGIALPGDDRVLLVSSLSAAVLFPRGRHFQTASHTAASTTMSSQRCDVGRGS